MNIIKFEQYKKSLQAYFGKVLVCKIHRKGNCNECLKQGYANYVKSCKEVKQ